MSSWRACSSRRRRGRQIGLHGDISISLEDAVGLEERNIEHAARLPPEFWRFLVQQLSRCMMRSSVERSYVKHKPGHDWSSKVTR